MPQYLVAIHHSDAYNPSSEDAEMKHNIDVLNMEMRDAGVRVLAMGLHPARTARSLQALPDGTVAVSEGPYLPGKEHMGGFWILECSGLDEAMEWGRKAVIACRASVEVRQFH